MQGKVYNYKSHSLGKKVYSGRNYSLMIGFIELVVEYGTNKLVDVCGFIPLINVKLERIEVPTYTEGCYCIQIKNDARIMVDGVYDFITRVDQTANEISSITFDREEGIICVGETTPHDNYKAIKINKNIICLVNTSNELKGILIKPDVFTK